MPLGWRHVGLRANWGVIHYWASGIPPSHMPASHFGPVRHRDRRDRPSRTTQKGALMPCIVRKRSGLLSSAAFATSALALIAVSTTTPRDVAFAQGAACGTQATAAGGAITAVEQGQTFGVTTNTSCGNLSTAGTGGTVDA